MRIGLFQVQPSHPYSITENTQQFSIFIFVLSLILLLISSLFCQKAALAIPTLTLISSSLLASSVIQLPKYLKRVTCSKGTLFNVIHCCIPFRDRKSVV